MASHISHNATLRLDSQCGTHTPYTEEYPMLPKDLNYRLLFVLQPNPTIDREIISIFALFWKWKARHLVACICAASSDLLLPCLCFAWCLYQMLSYAQIARIAHIAVCDANLLIRLKFSERQNDSLWYPYKNNTFACRYLPVWILAQKFSLFLSSYNYWTGMNAK